MSIVIDASFAIRLCDHTSPTFSVEAATALAERDLIAPPIFWHEVASGLRNMMFHQGLTAGDRFPIIEAIRQLDIGVEAPSPRMEPVMSVSDTYQLTIYDAAYLELAIRTASDLATRDTALLQKAPSAGVSLVVRP